MPKRDFDAWLHRVDVLVMKTIGLGINDLEDQPFFDWWDDGLTPLEAARETLQNVGWTHV